MDRTCPKCFKVFTKPCLLKQHQARKTPCAPIVEREDLSEDLRKKAYNCRYCGRPFTTPQGLSRHTRQNCKIANSDEGMEKLMDRTLQRQLTAQNAKIDELTMLVKQIAVNQNIPVQQAASTPNRIVTRLEQTQIINGPIIHGPVTNNNVQITLVPWDSDGRIQVPIDAIRAAFTENPRLVEYCRLDDEAKTNAETASPYVTEALVDLTRRAHMDPVLRNVYLNPKRADQVLVCLKTGSWEVRSLADATRLLFDGVASSIHRAVLTDTERRQLPLDVQNAASYVPILYEDEPEKYVKEGKTPMAAHLSNTHPQTGTAVALV